MDKWIYIGVICLIFITPSLGQQVQFTLEKENCTFRKLKIKRLVVEDSVYLLPPDSSTFLLDIRLPSRIRVEFKKGFVEFQINDSKTYCEDGSIFLKLYKLKKKRYTYYLLNCSSMGLAGLVLRLKYSRN